MRGQTVAAFGVVLLFGFAAPGTAVVYVDCDAPGPHDGTSWDRAFSTIQEGVDAATPNGEVWVADGTYPENVVMGEGVAIYGGYAGYGAENPDERDWAKYVTTIDGNKSGSCFVMALAARVDGFTVTNGIGTSVGDVWYGGGFYCANLGQTGVIANNTIAANSVQWGFGGGICCQGSSPIVADNIVNGNVAIQMGGGICCLENSSPIVTNNTISVNSVGGEYGSGAGLYCEGNSSPSVINNTISGNTARGWGARGGGMCCTGGASPLVSSNALTNNHAIGTEVSGDGGGIFCYCSSPTVTNNTISGNTAGSMYGGPGGGICCRQSSPTLTNNTITANLAWDGGGVYCLESWPNISNNIVTSNSAGWGDGGGIQCEESWPTLSHNDFWGNLPYDYYGAVPGEGDISADPLFANPDAGDYHLTAGSPCIDAGTNDAPGLPESDWDGEERIVNGVVDVGADEYVTYYTEAPDPQPECDAPLFGGSQAGFPAWVWFSIPLTPDCVVGSGCADPNELLGFECNGRLWYWDKYSKSAQVYRPPFLLWDLAVGNSYLLYLETDVVNPSYDGIAPFIPWTFEFRLGRQGWTWVGLPGLTELAGDGFMDAVRVKYPSDETGAYRTAQADRDATPDNWLTWGWHYWNTWLQAPETFTPYAPFGHRTCYPWLGYRCWVQVGTAVDEDDPDQATLIWR